MRRAPIVLPPRGAEPVRRIRVGEVDVYPILQLRYRVDPSLFFPDIASWPVDERAWYWQQPYAEEGRLAIDMGGFLLRTADRTILVDAGVGNDKSRPNPNFDHRSDPWLATMARAGVGPGEVDTVVFTHLHIDHVGYATSWTEGGWRPTFPNARHLVTAEELDFWTSRSAGRQRERLGDYVSDSVLPLADHGVLTIVESDHEVAEGMQLFSAPGHTPGNVCLEVRSGGVRAVFSGDMVHHALQLAFPARSTDYCVDPGSASRSRELLLDGLGPDDLLFPAHFPGLLPGRVHAEAGGGYRYEVVAGSVIA